MSASGGWLGGRGEEFDEIVGYHFEQAHRSLADLGTDAERSRALAERAAERLAGSGRRAFARSDLPAAQNLLERAAGLLPADDPRRLRLQPSLGWALIDRGDWDQARVVLAQTAEAGQAAGERGAVAHATVALAYLDLHSDRDTRHDEVRLRLEDAIGVFEETEDVSGLARALTITGMFRLWRGEAGPAVDDLERAATYAHEVGDVGQEAESLRSKLTAALHGPTDVDSCLAMAEDVRLRTRGSRRAEVAILSTRAWLEAMRGDFAVARDLIAEARALAEELGLEMLLAASVLRAAGCIELIAGDPVAAERALRTASETLERMGDWGHLASVTPFLADALCAQGRPAEALRWLDLTSSYVLEDDLDGQIGMRRSLGKVLAHRGDFPEAERLVREATLLAIGSDFLSDQADALTDLAEVLRLAGRPEEAAAALEEAIGVHERKGSIAGVNNARALLTELAAQPPATA